MAEYSSLLFITGGVRCGKSQFAEKTAADKWKLTQNSQLHYIAAMEPTDAEMRNRISYHQVDRIKSGLDWQTWEKPTRIIELIPHFKKEDIVLLDCLTTWLNNELFFQEDSWQDKRFQEELIEEMWTAIHAISKKVEVFIIVSNEVLYEPVGSNELVFVYRKILGKLHQRIVENAYEAFLVEAGIPLLMKGEIGCMA